MKGGNSDILMGVKVKEGKLHLGTPLYTAGTPIGKVTSIQKNHKELKEAELGDEVCIRLVKDNSALFGKHFTERDPVFSHITRESIDTLKKHVRDKLSKQDWLLVKKLKEKLLIK